MIKNFDVYGSESSFSEIIKKVESRISNDSEAKYYLEFPQADRNIEYYQHGLERMTVCLDSNNGILIDEIEKLCSIFTKEEEERLSQYTPWLRYFVRKEYFEKNIFSECLIIFREHSLISVHNIYKIFEDLGLKPENAVYYSKGDRCKNIFRIEESFKNKGYGVFVLSPFESVSPTGKSEDEKITPEASERVYEELLPYFEKAREENQKVIVFDDGGLMITTVIDLFAKAYGDLIYGYIETTKGGMHSINSRTDLNVTVINLADCVIKNLLNAVIGHSIVQRLREMTPHVGLRGQSVVVVGYGTLGRAISKDLRRLGMSVYVCDTDNERIFEALTDGFPVSKDAGYMIREFKPILVMGCTGLDALTYDNLSQIQRDTYVATVSSNEIKQSYPKFDKLCGLEFVDNYARTYILANGKKLIILGNGASLNLYNGEGANHSEYQPFLAAMIETIIYSVINGPIKGKCGLDTDIADKILNDTDILGKYLKYSNSLIGEK
jgi:hypothetical protein